MRAPGFDPAVIAADAVALAELPGGTGSEQIRIDWLLTRLSDAPGHRQVDEVGNLVWMFGPAPYRLALLVHVDDVFDASTPRGITERDGWLCGPGIGDNAVAVAITAAVGEHIDAGTLPLAIVFTVGEEGVGGLRGARHACKELAPESVVAVEGHGVDRVFTEAVGSLRVRLTVTGPGGHSWWDRGRPSATHGLIQVLGEMITTTAEPLSVNVGILEGGSGVNSIASQARASVEWRATDQGALDRQRAAVGALSVPDGLQLSVEQLDSRPAGGLQLDHPLTFAVMAARRALGLPTTAANGSTDANAALDLGIAAVAVGCCHGENMHAVTERIRTDSITIGAAQLDAVLHSILDLP